jgi:hypothetical protein
MAATRRRRVSGAAGQSVRNAVTVAGSAGSAGCPAAAHQSVNSAQIAVYPVPVGPDVPDQRVGADLLRTGGGGRVARVDQRVDHLATGQVPTGGDRDARPVPVRGVNVAGRLPPDPGRRP